MKVRTRYVAMWAAAVWSLVGATSGVASGQELNNEIDRVIFASKLSRAKIGVSIVDASSGAVLAERRSGEAFTPASNMKLLTSGAALMVLGANYSFRTEIVREGDRLIVRGGGDPAFADADVLKGMSPPMNVEDVLGRLVTAVRQSGLTSVREIVLDDRVFDREFVHPTWSPAHLNNGYAAEVSGINFHRNVLLAYPKANPQGPGTPPLLTLEPACAAITLINRGQTVAENRSTAWIARSPAGNVFTLNGDVGPRTSPQVEVTIHSNAEFFGQVLAERLERAGVTVARTGNDASVRLAEKDEEYAGTVVALVTTPIAEVLERCNAHSENLYAESLLKLMGHAVTREPGSWTNGTAVLRMMISEKLGAEAAAKTTIVDGSGLSRENAVAPGTFTRWLTTLASNPTGEVYVGSLAQPGKPGTLEKRFRGVRLGNELRAKSGFINGVRTLSGYLTNRATGRRVVFSIMVNDLTGEDNRAALDLHEAIVKEADEWLTRRSAAAGVEPARVGG